MATKLNRLDRDYRESKAVMPEQKPEKSRLTLMIVLAVLLLAAGAGGAWWYLGQVQDGTASKPPVFVSLETFTVNLQSEHSDQHLQTNLTLKIGDARTLDLIKLHMPEVRNRILLLLSNKESSQITDIAGKKKLAAELLTEINQPFSEGSTGQIVESVLFTSFVIQ
ncbi:flagellar basal body-associated protein FliL [Nitrosospira briensis]|uniref:Flagellar protein FliL n=1 Tax=Nitrosospira briensis TaxID=35799 RepID=A0A1I4Y9F0_9PROT|nr:flagellar basal body-associated protein FliL [Nitrosospira briensis]SFN34662.1 flagellar FliL protein [Nitrosospira briensis]SFN71212.1 flagellar FliL protein [Nitrosospira briensis]